MGSSAAVFGAIVAIVAIFLGFATRYEWMRHSLRTQLEKLTGLMLPARSTDEIVDDAVRTQRTTLYAGAAGAVIASLAALVIAWGDGDLTPWLVVLFCAGGGVFFGGWADLVRGTLDRAAANGPASHDEGASLASFVGWPTIAASVTLAVLSFASFAWWVSLYARYGITNVEASPVAITLQVAGSALIACALIATLSIATAAARRRQAAPSNELLAWGDGLFARKVGLLMLSGIQIAAFTALNSSTLYWSLLPDGGDFRFERTVSLWLTTGTALVGLALQFVVISPRAPKHFLRSLWPEVYEARRLAAEQLKAAQRAEREALNADFKRAHAGLPPLEKVSTPE